MKNKDWLILIIIFFPIFMVLVSCFSLDGKFIKNISTAKLNLRSTRVDSDGKYIAKIRLKMTPQILKRNKLYTIEEDEEGYHVAKRYKVTWKY